MLALEHGKQKARSFLQTAATLDLTFPGPGQARLRITNQTGHKLPTGYPEGRRMWVNVRFLGYAEFPDRLRTLHDNLKPGGRLPRPKRAI